MHKVIGITLIIIGLVAIAGGGYGFYRNYQTNNTKKLARAELAKLDVSKLEGVDPIFKKSVKTNLDLSTKEGLKQLDENIVLMAAKTAALPRP